MNAIGILAISSLVFGVAEWDENKYPSQPYRVVIALEFENHPRLPSHVRGAVARDVDNLSTRLLGDSWQVVFADPAKGGDLAPLQQHHLARLLPAVMGGLSAGGGMGIGAVSLAFAHRDLAAPADKLFWVSTGLDPGDRATTSAVTITVLEYDFEFSTWGPPAKKRLSHLDHLGQETFELIYEQFRPQLLILDRTAETATGDTLKKIKAIARAAALQPAVTSRPVVRPGLPFRPYRNFFRKRLHLGRSDLSFTFVVFRELAADRLTADCDVVTVMTNPFSRRAQFRVQTVALAATTTPNASTTVEFVSVTGKGRERQQAPVVGLEAVALPLDQPGIARLGNTDRRGRVTVRAEKLPAAEVAAKLFRVQLRVGSGVLSEFPVVPGDYPNLTIAVRPDPKLSEVNGRILRLQEDVVDLLARRAILTKRMKNLEEKESATPEDKKKAIELSEQLNALPKQAVFKERLEEIQLDVEEWRKATKRVHLSWHYRRLFTQTEQMLNDYWRDIEVQLGVESNVTTSTTSQ